MRTHRIARRRAGWALTVALAVALTGCQSLRDGGAGNPPVEDHIPPVGSPAEAGAPLVQVSASGGFVPFGWDFQAVPTLTLYGDGRAIVPGPQIMIYPGPLLPNLQVEQVSPADLAAIETAARDAGLLAAAPDYGLPNVTDVPTTYVSITVDGVTYEHAAYALGMVGDEGGGADLGWTAADAGLTAEQAAARATLAGFIRTASELVGASGAGEPYSIEALAVLARSTDQVGSAVAEDGEVVPWPIDVPLADAAECVVVDGDATRVLLAALATANQATLFQQDGVTYQVWFRPLLPHEPGCVERG